MKQLLSSILLALVVSFYVVPVNAQEQKPVAGVTVMICDADGNVISKSKTDRDGRYDITVTRASSDYYLKIDEKDRASKIAIKEQGVKQAVATDDQGESRKGYDYYLSISDAQGYTVKSPRDLATGQSSGKRQHGAISITSDFTACAISIDEPGVHVTGQIYGMAINEKGLPGNKPTPKSNK
jgi:hypothetical protein